MIQTPDAPDVAAAKEKNVPSFALDRAVFPDEMAWPEPKDGARMVEKDVHNASAVSATIGTRARAVHIGLTDARAQSQNPTHAA